MKLVSSSILSLCFAFGLSAQKLEQEVTHEIESLTKDSYCGSVSYDPSNEVTSLYYVEKDQFVTKFKTYLFDKDLKFMKEDIKKYTFGDAWRDAMKEIAGLFKWFKYSGESYTREWISIEQGMGGKVVAMKQKATWHYSWFFGGYIPKFETAVKVKIKSETDDKIHLYTHYVNTETGDAYLIVGEKAPKGSKVKRQHARNFQIVKVTSDLEVEYMEEFKFDYKMCVSFSKIIYPPGEEPDEEYTVPDVVGGEYYVIFSPVKGSSGKEELHPVKGQSKIVVLTDAGKIKAQLDFTVPTEGWVIKDMVKSPDGKDYYFAGPAKEGVYIDQVSEVISPLVMSNSTKDIKYKNYQIMKISDGKVAWINSTPLEDFATKASAPPSQKKMPEYGGKNFDRRIISVTPAGELLLCGQNYDKVAKKDASGNWVYEIRYKDLILAHFDNQGVLKRAYGVRRDKMNSWSKQIVTPMDLYLTPGGKTLYWVYGEIEGMKQGFSFGGIIGAAGVGTVSKRKLLYYPAVAKIDLTTATIGDFQYLGADAEGKQRYYTHPGVGQIMSSDGKKLIFVGEDKPGKLVWLAKMAID